MKNNITYYIHYADSDTHPKFKMLRVKYGWAGEGKFWALNNKIAEAENCELNLAKKYNKASIANDLNFTLEQFDEFLEYLEKDCDLIVKKNNYITTEIVREILIKVMKDRKRNKENYEKRIIQDVNKVTTQVQHVESKIKHVESIQSKGKERKLKESKEVYSPTSNEVRLSNLLLDLILNKKDNFKKPDIQKWSLHIDRILHIDKRTPEEIEKVIRWCQYDDFWCVNILSTEKLRKQIDKLEIRMNNKPNKQGAGYGQIKRHSEGYPEGTPFEECKK